MIHCTNISFLFSLIGCLSLIYSSFEFLIVQRKKGMNKILLGWWGQFLDFSWTFPRLLKKNAWKLHLKLQIKLLLLKHLMYFCVFSVNLKISCSSDIRWCIGPPSQLKHICICPSLHCSHDYCWLWCFVKNVTIIYSKQHIDCNLQIISVQLLYVKQSLENTKDDFQNYKVEQKNTHKHFSTIS